MTTEEREYKIIKKVKNEDIANNSIRNVRSKMINLSLKAIELVFLLMIFSKEQDKSLKDIIGLISLITAGYSIYDIVAIIKSLDTFLKSAGIADNIDLELKMESLRK